MLQRFGELISYIAAAVWRSPRRGWIFLAAGVGLLYLCAILNSMRTPPAPLPTSAPTMIPPTKQVLYTCPIIRQNEPQVVATCKDCTHYPVDKSHGLPWYYIPKVVDTGRPGLGQVAPAVNAPLKALFFDIAAHGMSPIVLSGYRSYIEQGRVFWTWVFLEWRQTGDVLVSINNALSYSAWPGHSEHQLGTAVDVGCQDCEQFDNNDPRNVALWAFLEKNAHKYGFVISYPQKMDNRTGYAYEPWHLRYVGVENATELYNQGYLTGNGICLLAMLKSKKQY
jgi:hypothetical protein